METGNTSTLTCFGFKLGNVAAFPFLFKNFRFIELAGTMYRSTKYDVRNKKSLIFETRVRL
jgi:hypothetical protein